MIRIGLLAGTLAARAAGLSIEVDDKHDNAVLEATAALPVPTGTYWAFAWGGDAWSVELEYRADVGGGASQLCGRLDHWTAGVAKVAVEPCATFGPDQPFTVQAVDPKTGLHLVVRAT